MKVGLVCSDAFPSTAQYASDDVVHLPKLVTVLRRKLQNVDRWHFALASFRYLPTRVRLDILKVGDVFTY